MPELPEVETSRRGITPYLIGQRIDDVVIRERRLRWPVSTDVDAQLPGATVNAVGRRAKYLLLQTTAGTAIVHLGMSGNVFVVERGTPAGIHDHFDIEFSSGRSLRYRDPRRFGSLHWAADADQHWLLRDLGPEPLGGDFSGKYLWQKSRGRRVAVKQFIMNAAIVVGVGNIYASESLFLAGIHPRRAAGRVAGIRYDALATAIKEVLEKAIRAGGTTLRDFYGGNGEPGYFRHELNVYARDGEPCVLCKRSLSAIVLGQRSTFYCKNCQR
ncbi:MAG: bifunctional DNA-formamidopyrimidine glycosylase/DNA-(apurinic or apyrimidinic site) lyase [Gammaproteobacteria bacterium]|nr:bifunctional DNA-formamidopyrimidine glycosylase/DNA-(apurinic or apyrimidinic site) lyase [Gammaproteobacteria bacterium]MDH3372363.1 bifunctional DNA-formamidopyrimidine glycosylase/DNA-(apurinic or apyrimidinic site) lyase [Gammaproteobacteria bacterium]MDH3408654.1 bifunctional DNA-formamidopyrimidine glycosylase/DNA-(apurinic or apyrimidinic site) lyase [Gammaproteobacteria bacterium]MDH3552912.1 bifunctional DNA-formamidopyrimidine glycosylase/DNA-(apurinic or apyrimidinic site) lyase [